MRYSALPSTARAAPGWPREERYATDLLSVQTSGVGYLLKDRVAHVSDFLDALRRVAAGGTALDPEVVAQLLVRRRQDPIDRLTPRELEVLRLSSNTRSASDHAGAAGQGPRLGRALGRVRGRS